MSRARSKLNPRRRAPIASRWPTRPLTPISRSRAVVAANSASNTGHPTRPPLVLIHGWLSKRADLAAVARAFRTSHRVVNIDLPGHGESEVPEDESRLRIPSFADDVAALCDELGLSGAALVGHSLGAAVAVELAVRRPELAAAVVALDGVVLMPSAMLEGFAPLLAALRSPAWQQALGGLLTSTFLPTDDPDLLRSLLADIDQMPQHVAAAVAEQMTDWDAESAVAALGRAQVRRCLPSTRRACRTSSGSPPSRLS